MKKVLIIFGSPRKNGNLSKMVQLAVKQSENLNYKVDYIDLYEKDIATCKGCMQCKKTGVCVINDDIQEIRQLLIECDLVIVASPTYFANVSAPVKNMFDRLVATVMDDNDNMIPKPKLSSNQQYILMTTCSTPAPFDKLAKQSTGCIKAMDEVLHISGMKCRGKVIFAGTRNKNQLPQKVINKITKLIN